MLSPLPRRSDWMYCFAHPSSRISLPRKGCQVGLRIVLFEDCSAFTRVTACTLALSPYFVTRFTRRLQPFRYLHSCSGCFRLEHFAGWDLHPLEKRRLCTAHTQSRHRTFPKTDTQSCRANGCDDGTSHLSAGLDIGNRYSKVLLPASNLTIFVSLSKRTTSSIRLFRKY